MDVGKEQFLIRGLGLLQSTEDIGAIVLKSVHGVPVYLRDVATVVEAPAPRFGAVTRDGEEVVLGMALARMGANAKDVVEAVKGKLDVVRSEEHTSELQSLMRISYAVLCLKKKKKTKPTA